MISSAMTTATATLTKKARNHYASSVTPSATFRGHAIDQQDDGTAIVRDVEIFRAGTFRDSWGEQHSWTAEHLNLMVSNFTLLRDQGIFVDVPVRRDHSMTIDKVMGYFEAMSVAGDKLVADYHVTEPTDIDKLARGTYRNVSLEVGMYTTNDEVSYWPVVFGVAYVDIPAVEGLHAKEKPEMAFFSQVIESPTKETNIVTKPIDPATPADVGAAKPETTDHAAAPAAAAPAAPVTFRIGGVDTSDHAAVQAHIVAIEADNTRLVGFEKDTIEDGRKLFVKALASDGKIAAPQAEAMETLVVSMADEQYEAFKAVYESAPKMSLFAEHGAGNPNPDGQPAAEDDERSILNEQIAMHRRSGMTDERIAQTKAAKRLAELNNKS